MRGAVSALPPKPCALGRAPLCKMRGLNKAALGVLTAPGNVCLPLLIHFLSARRAHECWMAQTMMAMLIAVPWALALSRTTSVLVDW